MAYSFESKWDTSSLTELNKRLSRVAKEAYAEVRKSNRAHANHLRDKIRTATPVAGGSVQHRSSWSKERGASRRNRSRHGQMKASIKSRVGADYAAVVGGGPRTPYFNVNEFGGGALWSNRTSSKRHVIPVRARSASIKSLGFKDKSNTQRGAAGWFFYPTIHQEFPLIEKQLVDDAVRVVTRTLSGRIT